MGGAEGLKNKMHSPVKEKRFVWGGVVSTLLSHRSSGSLYDDILTLGSKSRAEAGASAFCIALPIYFAAGSLQTALLETQAGLEIWWGRGGEGPAEGVCGNRNLSWLRRLWSLSRRGPCKVSKQGRDKARHVMESNCSH